MEFKTIVRLRTLEEAVLPGKELTATIISKISKGGEYLSKKKPKNDEERGERPEISPSVALTKDLGGRRGIFYEV